LEKVKVERRQKLRWKEEEKRMEEPFGERKREWMISDRKGVGCCEGKKEEGEM
jgi:hypothetical protein